MSMCFSATASFTAAGLIGAIGIVTLTRAQGPRELLLAATPLLFALQQAIEGLLWLQLPLAPDGSISTGLTLIYLLFSNVFWPVYAPLAVLLIEPGAGRRRFMAIGLGAGTCVAAYLLWTILALPHGALIRDGHIVYVTQTRQTLLVAASYVAAVSLPLLASSQRTVVILGAIVFAGCAIAYAFYWEGFVSVWCFFAAGGSAVIVFHFEKQRHERLHTARI
jgi:hypothetical protein